jgi:malate synthase
MNNDKYSEIINDDSISFVKSLYDKFGNQLQEILKQRTETDIKKIISVRQANWTCNRIPDEVKCRQVEITGPANDTKLFINALNSDADVFMADIEDSQAPTCDNILQSQLNFRQAHSGNMTYFDSKKNKEYVLQPDKTILMARPRGLHLPESHFEVNGNPIPACLFDVGMYLWHNIPTIKKRPGRHAYLYLPKLEHYTESHWWDQVLHYIEKYFYLPRGWIKVTVLIETLTAAQEMEEIVFTLKDRCLGLNCGRWDYLFSIIKKYENTIFPDRASLGMSRNFMDAYSKKLVHVCHKRGIFGMGGMAAQIPVRNDPEKNRQALEKVRQDKVNEFKNGHDGSWVAHPFLIEIAREIFSAMDGPNQISRQTEEVSDESLTDFDISGPKSLEGFQDNLNALWEYTSNWLNGNGCVGINHKMEDAATAEISRCQLWQWYKHKVVLDNGETVDEQLLLRELDSLGENEKTRKYVTDFICSDTLDPFLTSKLYPDIV